MSARRCAAGRPGAPASTVLYARPAVVHRRRACAGCLFFNFGSGYICRASVWLCGLFGCILHVHWYSTLLANSVPFFRKGQLLVNARVH